MYKLPHDFQLFTTQHEASLLHKISVLWLCRLMPTFWTHFLHLQGRNEVGSSEMLVPVYPSRVWLQSYVTCMCVCVCAAYSLDCEKIGGHTAGQLKQQIYLQQCRFCSEKHGSLTSTHSTLFHVLNSGNSVLSCVWQCHSTMWVLYESHASGQLIAGNTEQCILYGCL